MVYASVTCGAHDKTDGRVGLGCRGGVGVGATSLVLSDVMQEKPIERRALDFLRGAFELRLRLFGTRLHGAGFQVVPRRCDGVSGAHFGVVVAEQDNSYIIVNRAQSSVARHMTRFDMWLGAHVAA
jgi:hypothetical protein